MSGDTNKQPLRGVPLLAKLSEADLRSLTAVGRERTYASGEAIVREGDPGDSLHLIVEGSVRITMLSPDGNERTIAVLEQHDCIGDLALLDGRPRSATAIATTTTRTLLILRDDFLPWIAAHPQAAIALLETLSLRLRRSNNALGEITFFDLPNRLARRLIELTGSLTYAQEVSLEPGAVRLRITQDELASMLGVSRESINKQLNQFAHDGWIALGRGSVTVLDRKTLSTLP